MILLDNNTILTITEVVSGILGLLFSIAKVIKEIKKAKKAEANRILQECKDLDMALKTKLETKINVLEAQLKNLKLDVNKDLSYLKDSHALELKNLGERIEALRSDLTTQHSQIINLLAKLIN